LRLGGAAVDHPVSVTRFRVWFQPEVDTAELGSVVWNGVRLAQRPLPFGIDAVDVTVVGNGGDLRRLVSERRDIFAALMELRPEDK
jgi:hypothetical protein